MILFEHSNRNALSKEIVLERIPADSWRNHLGHVYRYELAAKLLRPHELVLDVACGIGYGAKVINEHLPSVQYIGVDKVEPEPDFVGLGKWHSGVDLNEWSPDFDFDVAICIETLEHLADPQNLVSQLKKAKRLIIISVPTRPTIHMNPFHLHDFTVDDIIQYFDGHELIHIEDQPEELSHIFVFAGIESPV
jgi:2-polyprenyl-3-methyl-5-hydroxy-6-metoxy-1,4-benzoquinol methylase